MDIPDTTLMEFVLEQGYPRFLGLTGSPQEADAARSAFRVYAARRGLESERSRK